MKSLEIHTQVTYGDSTQLIFLRARWYNPTDGRFQSRDTWRGNYNHPLSLNRWNYTEGNPVNFSDPLGLWSIAPGLELSNGGLYRRGQLTLPTYALCTTACYTERGSKESVPIFVPSKENGILYNDIILQSPRCDAWELIIPTNTNDWNVIFRTRGKSWAFSQGAGTSWTVGLASGMGFDSGFVPINAYYGEESSEEPGQIQTDPSSYYSVNGSIAFALFRAQSQAEREAFNLVQAFDTLQANVYEARVGTVIFIFNGWAGTQAFNSRLYTITVQEHKSVRNFYRAIIETTSAFQNVRTGTTFMPSSFLSFENSTWKEHGFNQAVKP
jgi:RHS repeat-associated protein